MRYLERMNVTFRKSESIENLITSIIGGIAKAVSDGSYKFEFD